MSPRRSTFRPASRYYGDTLVRALVITVAVEVVAHLVVGLVLAQYLASRGHS